MERKTFLQRMRKHLSEISKWQPCANTKERFFDKDEVEDVLDDSIWEDPEREVAFRWIETKYGLRLAFKLRGDKRIEYVSLARVVAAQVSNPVLQMFELTRDSMRNGLTMKAGTKLFFVIGSGDAPEMQVGFDDEEGQNEKLIPRNIPTNGVSEE